MTPSRAPLRLASMLWIPVILALGTLPASAAAQRPTSLIAGGGIGATYYCIVTRCGSGTILLANVGLEPSPFLLAEVGARRHFCFDCDRFSIAEASLQLRYPGQTLQPYLGAGLGLISDPGFMGREAGLLGAAGVSFWPWRNWGARLEVRARRLRAGDGMGELSVSGARRFPGLLPLRQAEE